MNQPENCQVCKKSFTDKDKVVVCPHCGAPYHKECYDEVGHCVYEGKHVAGYEYQSAAQKTQAQENPQQKEPDSADAAKSKQGEGFLCPNCRTINASSNIFCERCGRPLYQSRVGNASSPFGGMPSFMSGSSYSQVSGFDLQGEFEGLSKRDWAAFIGPSLPAYFLRMEQQDQRKTKLSFTLSAFFFSYFYFAYRKMWLWALLAVLVESIFLVPGFLAVYVEAGVPFVQTLSLEFLNQLQNVFYVLGLVRNMFFGLFALQIYRKDAAKKIRKIQKNASADQNISLLLARKGGVSVLGILAVLALFFTVSTLWLMGGGDVLMNYMVDMMNL